MKINQIVVEVFNNKETGTTHKGGVVTKTSHGIKHTKNDYDDGHGVQGAKSSGKESKYKQTPILDKDDDLDEGVAEARDGDTNFGSTVGNGSWVVYDGNKVKRFKSRDGAKAYAEKNGGKVASSEHYADNIQKQEVDEDMSRRGFLKGLGAVTAGAALGGATGDAKAGINEFGEQEFNKIYGLLFTLYACQNQIPPKLVIPDNECKLVKSLLSQFSNTYPGGKQLLNDLYSKVYDISEKGNTPNNISGAWATALTNSSKRHQWIRDFQSLIQFEESIEEGETWAKHNNPRAGGMSKKSVSSYRRSHPGSKIQTAVTTKPSKLKKGSKAAKRRKSFCARMKGMKKSRTSAKTARDPNSNINKSLRRWNCESVEQMRELVMLAEQFIAKHKK
jgi:hypothetical protein